ncbi:MAG: hypothetical protein AAGF57_01545 [Pseudomonadota bacterium]
MLLSTACKRYLQQYREINIPVSNHNPDTWQHVLVIPAYKESPELLKRLTKLARGRGRSLVILVLNHPDTQRDSEINKDVRQAANRLVPASTSRPQIAIKQLNPYTDLYVHDLDRISGPLPASQGVGLARKTGCDIAFTWIRCGSLSTQWICCSDADAILPSTYFSQLENIPEDRVAAVYPFRHVTGGDLQCDAATALYELRLHHYRLGLEYAHSPYAMHTLGSAMAVKATSYAQVRGFPKRSGGEDFYLLNKLAKVGTIELLTGEAIKLTARASDRIPFGTGPAVQAIQYATEVGDQPLFYHPDCFLALRGFLQSIDKRAVYPEGCHSKAAFTELEMAAELSGAVCRLSDNIGLPAALDHCRRQSTSATQYLRQFHQWFDGFRTLKFIHGIRDAGWPMQSYNQLQRLNPVYLPGSVCWQNVESQLQAIRRYWAWT